MGENLQPGDLMGAIPPGRVGTVRELLSKKQLALTEVVIRLRTGATVAAALDEIRLCMVWAAALNDAGPDLPPPSQDEPLLNAIARVESALANMTLANNVAEATLTLIQTFKAPG